MDGVRVAIRAQLTADATLTALLSTAGAIFHRVAPRDAVPPYVIFDRQAGTEKETFGGEAGEGQVWLVKGICRGLDAGPAEAIDARVKTTLNLAELVVDGKPVQSVRRESRVEFGEADGAEQFHHVGALYRVDVQPAT
jgi:hypothetical protein